MMATDGSSLASDLGLGTVQFDLDREQRDLLHVRLTFGLSKLICNFAELHYDALLVPEAPDYHTCSFWLANFLLGITVTVGLGVRVHAEITE